MCRNLSQGPGPYLHKNRPSTKGSSTKVGARGFLHVCVEALTLLLRHWLASAINGQRFLFASKKENVVNKYSPEWVVLFCAYYFFYRPGNSAFTFSLIDSKEAIVTE